MALDQFLADDDTVGRREPEVGWRIGKLPGCALLFLSVIVAGSCQSYEVAQARFSDQHFKTAIALIELHQTRFGQYPAALAELQFLGDWDQFALAEVEYRLLEGGYELNLVGDQEMASLPAYPEEFFVGLGVKKTNVPIASR